MFPRVFVFFADVAVMPGQTIDPAISDGRHVYSYVGAADERRAVERLELDLTHRGLRLVNLQWCVDQDGLERDEPPEPTAAEAERQARSGQIVYEPVSRLA
jgi:hypothetical protein